VLYDTRDANPERVIVDNLFFYDLIKRKSTEVLTGLNFRQDDRKRLFQGEGRVAGNPVVFENGKVFGTGYDHGRLPGDFYATLKTMHPIVAASDSNGRVIIIKTCCRL